MSGFVVGFVCKPRIYEYENWLFDWPAYGGPWPLKQDGELRQRAGRRFWQMITRFDALPAAEQAQHRIGGGCVRIVELAP
jgi:hypothetical protein